jgi:hypothetical protein
MGSASDLVDTVVRSVVVDDEELDFGSDDGLHLHLHRVSQTPSTGVHMTSADIGFVPTVIVHSAVLGVSFLQAGG